MLIFRDNYEFNKKALLINDFDLLTNFEIDDIDNFHYLILPKSAKDKISNNVDIIKIIDKINKNKGYIIYL